MRKVTEVLMSVLPKCVFCEQKAAYDGKTLIGPWAYMCERHWLAHGAGKLGLGLGQKLILKTEVQEQNEDK